MIAVTISGQACWLITAQPGDNTPVRLTATIPVNLERSLTGGTLRRLAGLTPRYALEWRAILLAADFAMMRAAALSMQDEPVLAPLWPHAWRPGIDTPTITAGLIVAYTADFATYAINPGSYSGYTYAAPLVFGRFKKPPRMAATTDGWVTADIAVEEDATAAYNFQPASSMLAADTTLANAAGYSAPVFPFLPDWSEGPDPQYPVTDVERASVGPGRQMASTFYPQTPEQVQAASFSNIGAAEAAAMLLWWTRRAGGADAHWVPGTQKLWKLASAAAATATSITVDTTIAAAPSTGTILALSDGSNINFARVTGVVGAVLTITPALANSFAVGASRVAPAFLARHTNDAFEINYSPGGWIGHCRLGWREVAAESTLPSGETRGTTLGRAPGSAWFFKIDLDYNGAVATTYLTNWESGASGSTVGSHSWVYNPCDFDHLIQSLDLQDDSCTFKLRWYAGCPWENWQPGVLAARGFLTIYRADVDTAGAFSNYAAVWKGELSSPTLDGPNLSVKVLGANALFSRRAPRQVMSTLCGTNLFSARCGIALSDWTWNATIASITGNLVTIGSIARANSGGNPSGFGAADWFALGWVGWTASGLPQRVGILTSAALSGGQIVLTLDRAPGLSGGASITAIPGCDRQGSTCRNKFNNYTNFRGFEYMPAVAPNFIVPQRTTNPAKK